MKTVGILTYHHYYNYGTMLQALALQQYIQHLGYQAEIIDYQHDTSMTLPEKIGLRFRRIPAYIREFEKYKILARNEAYQTERKRLFDSFYAAYVKTGSKKYTSIEALKRDKPFYDGYVVGSDQTWNPYVSNRPEAFYLSFVDDHHRKGSYAPSLPVTDLTEEHRAYLKKYLSDFAYVSCRERTGAEELGRILGRAIPCVIDPTLLLNPSQWGLYEDDLNPGEYGDYILVYFLGENKEHRALVGKIQSMTGYRVVTVPMAYPEMENDDWHRVTVGPGGFLKLIHHAKMVCTDSFHGTMFSMNYHKPFFSFRRMKDGETASNNSRLYDSLALFSLEDRIIRTGADIDAAGRISYADVEEKLKAERTKADDYLRSMLADITS